MKKIGLISVLCIAACNSAPAVEDKDAAPADSAAPKATAAATVEVAASAVPTASAAVAPSAVVSAAPTASAVAPKK